MRLLYDTAYDSVKTAVDKSVDCSGNLTTYNKGVDTKKGRENLLTFLAGSEM